MTDEQFAFERKLDEKLADLRRIWISLPEEERPMAWLITYIGAPEYFQWDEVR